MVNPNNVESPDETVDMDETLKEQESDIDEVEAEEDDDDEIDEVDDEDEVEEV